MKKYSFLCKVYKKWKISKSEVATKLSQDENHSDLEFRKSAAQKTRLSSSGERILSRLFSLISDPNLDKFILDSQYVSDN